jgi:hypothetical protein
MLGWDAAVIETVSPSQLRPAVIQRMSISGIAGSDAILRAATAVASAIVIPLADSGRAIRRNIPGMPADT